MMTKKAKPTPFGPRSPEHAQAMADSLDWKKLLADFDLAQVAMVPKDKDGNVIPKGEAGNPPPSKFVRAYWREMANLLAAADVALVAEKQLPAGLATVLRALAGTATDLGAGIIPDPVKDIARGRPGTSLDEMGLIRAAIIYVAVCLDSDASGEELDHNPIEVVANRFRVGEETVDGWLLRFPVEPEEIASANFDDALEGMLQASKLYTPRFRIGDRPQPPDSAELEEQPYSPSEQRDELRKILTSGGFDFYNS